MNPAVDVGVVEVGALLAHPAKVGRRDTELVGQVPIGDGGRAVRSAGGVEDGGAGDAGHAVLGTEVEERGDDVDLGSLLLLQDVGEVGQGCVRASS